MTIGNQILLTTRRREAAQRVGGAAFTCASRVMCVLHFDRCYGRTMPLADKSAVCDVCCGGVQNGH